MFNLDWSNPATLPLNITNLILLVVTVACVAIVGAGIFQELSSRLRKRAGILQRMDEHELAVPGLGWTMADGGEPEKRAK